MIRLCVFFKEILVTEREAVHLLRWNDVPRMSRIFCTKLQHFHSFKYI